jgi:hypothetical protein
MRSGSVEVIYITFAGFTHPGYFASHLKHLPGSMSTGGLVPNGHSTCTLYTKPGTKANPTADLGWPVAAGKVAFNPLDGLKVPYRLIWRQRTGSENRRKARRKTERQQGKF